MAECNNYSGIKLMCHVMKLFERLVEDILRQVIEICSTQYGFQHGNFYNRVNPRTKNDARKSFGKKSKST